MEKIYKGVNTPFGKLDLKAYQIACHVRLVSMEHDSTVGWIENCKSFPDSLENITIDWQDNICIDTNHVSDTLMEYVNLYQDGTIVKETFEI